MINISKIEYAIQNMYFFKQLLPPDKFQEFLEDFVFLYKNKSVFNLHTQIYKEMVSEIKSPIQEIFIEEKTDYTDPNFILKNSHDNRNFEEVYQQFKMLCKLIQKDNIKEAYQFFNSMQYHKK